VWPLLGWGEVPEAGGEEWGHGLSRAIVICLRGHSNSVVFESGGV